MFNLPYFFCDFFVEKGTANRASYLECVLGLRLSQKRVRPCVLQTGLDCNGVLKGVGGVASPDGGPKASSSARVPPYVIAVWMQSVSV